MRAQLEGQMRGLLDAAQEAVVVLDRAWNYVYANAAALELLDMDGSVIGSDARLAHPEAVSTGFAAAYTRVMGGGPAETVEEHYEPLDTYLRARVLPLEQGIAVALWDVSEQRRFEHLLVRDRDLYQQVLAHTTTAIALRDLDDRYLLANPAACQMIGRSEGDIVGRTSRELFDVGIAERMDALHREVQRTGQVREVEGPEAWQEVRGRKVLAQVFPVFDHEQRLMGTGTAATDVSRIVELETELAASRKRYRDVFSSTSLGVLLIRADGSILEANTAICRMLGYSRAQLLTMQAIDLLPRSALERERIRRKVLAQGHLGYEDEVEMVRSDGDLLPALVTVNTFDDPDAEGRLISVLVRDRSRVAELQKRLVASERLEAAGRLAAGVAHDSNNILAALSGYVELLHEEIGGSPAAQRHVAAIERCIARAGEMVSHLLAFTRGQHLQATEVDLGSVVRDLEGILRQLLPAEADLTLETRAAPVLTDPAQVRQVVLNLVVNAREALQGTGLVQVTTGVLELAGDAYLADGSYACLSVFDNGGGMEEAVAQRCFEPFFSTRVAHGGTGLGLSTAHGIARQSGGDLRVRTAPGEGAEFQLLLPLQAGAVAVQPTPQPASEDAAGWVILLADDDPDGRELLAGTLRSNGHRVVEAADGRAALAARVLPDLLVTDLEMPNMGGPELAAALRQRLPGLPVLFISGSPAPPGLRPFLAKPFTATALLAAVETALQRSGA